MDERDISTVLFDMDGTLIDTAPSIASALSEMRSARGGGELSAEDARGWVSLGADALIRNALGPLMRDPADDLALFRQALTRHAPTPQDLYAGAVEALSRLSAAGVAMAVVTNKPERIAKDLNARLGLGQFFQTVIGGDTLSVAKPRPEPVHEALRRLRRGGRAAFVGDSVVDADACVAAGVPFYLYLAGYGAAQCGDEKVAGRFNAYADLADLLGIGVERPTGERSPA